MSGWTLMTHESHGTCFCGEVHCSNGRGCNSIDEHPQFIPPTSTEIAAIREAVSLRSSSGTEES